MTSYSNFKYGDHQLSFRLPTLSLGLINGGTCVRKESQQCTCIANHLHELGVSCTPPFPSFRHGSCLARGINDRLGIGQLRSSTFLQGPWHMPRLRRLRLGELRDPRRNEGGILVITNACGDPVGLSLKQYPFAEDTASMHGCHYGCHYGHPCTHSVLYITDLV